MSRFEQIIFSVQRVLGLVIFTYLAFTDGLQAPWIAYVVLLYMIIGDKKLIQELVGRRR